MKYHHCYGCGRGIPITEAFCICSPFYESYKRRKEEEMEAPLNQLFEYEIGRVVDRLTNQLLLLEGLNKEFKTLNEILEELLKEYKHQNNKYEPWRGPG